MRIAITIILVLMMAAPAHGADWFTWDDDNTALHVPLTVLFVADLGQTLWIADNCHKQRETFKFFYDNRCREINNILGEQPNRGEVYTYFAASYALTTFAVWALPEKYSHALQGGVISLELYIVDNNAQLGVGVKF